jgi:H+/Cl- antiporter ClcA
MNARPQHDPGQHPAEAASTDSEFVALTKSPGFGVIIRYAALFGVVLAFAALAFLGLVKGGTQLWFTLPKHPGWLDGSLWWVAVTAAAGVLVGVLRRVLRVPAKLPGTFKEIAEQRVDPSTAPAAVVVSLVSLAGGASLGPEDALGKIGGGLGTWVSERQKLSEDVQATNTLSGMAAAYGGLLASPILATMLVLEVARQQARRFADTLVASLLSSSVAFAIYFPIAGTTFVGIFAVPAYKYKDWQLLAAIPLGLAAGALALIMVIAIGAMTKLTAPLATRPIPRATIGGIMFGLVGVALPLTLFTGTAQLPTVIHDGAALGAGLLIAVVFAKMLVFGLCQATGFIGGPVLVSLFIGGTAGTAAHVLIPGLPEGLAFTTMFAALPGALVAAPFSLIVLTALTTQIGALQTVPVAIAVVTSYLAVSGTGTLQALAHRARKPAPAVPSGRGPRRIRDSTGR